MEQLFNMTSAKWLTNLLNFAKIIMNTFYVVLPGGVVQCYGIADYLRIIYLFISL